MLVPVEQEARCFVPQVAGIPKHEIPVQLLKSIQHLLYTEGYTIKGVQKLLKLEGKKKVSQALPEAQNSNEKIIDPADAVSGRAHVSPENAALARASGFSQTQEEALSSMLDELKSLRSLMAAE